MTDIMSLENRIRLKGVGIAKRLATGRHPRQTSPPGMCQGARQHSLASEVARRKRKGLGGWFLFMSNLLQIHMRFWLLFLLLARLQTPFKFFYAFLLFDPFLGTIFPLSHTRIKHMFLCVKIVNPITFFLILFLG